MLNINNFIFKLNKTTSTTKYYRCEDSRCTVTARTDLQDILLNIKGDHCHPPKPEEIQIRTFKQVVKTRAISESTPIPQIYDEEAVRMDLSTLSIAALPSQRELSSTLNKARRLQTPSIPNSQLFDISESYRKTLKNLPFVCVDQIIKRKTRILVFASNEQLKLLFNSSVILMDGTFSSSPPIFDQTTSTPKYYRCEDSRCTVTARTDLQDTLLNIKGDHCHPPEPEEIQIRTFKQVVKTRAISESTPIPQIYDEEAVRMDLSTLSIAALPSQRELS
ncbi:unnamed protein product [Rotaria sp. Silwood1]|nr:unnamed protein product [Rotaria sp. Silwood1]